MQNELIFCEEFHVMEHDCDWNQKMTPGAFLRMAQQIATDDGNRVGMDRKYYEDNHTAFLLARLALRFDRVPRAGEMLTLKTFPEGAKRASYKRVTIAFDENGEQVALVDSRWILVDTQTRRIMRRPPEGFLRIPFLPEVSEELDTTIREADVLESCGDLTARYSICDENGHVNNTRYADAAGDVLPLSCLRDQSITEMVIRYHKELPAGETAELERGELEPGCWYIRGTRQGKPCFEVNLRLG